MNEVLEELKWKKFQVLDQGFVCLVDCMGDDSAICDAARVSYGKGTRSVSDDRTLLRYLMRHYHGTPFEMCEIVLKVRIPMDCWRQMVRHRAAPIWDEASMYSEPSINEHSTRYSEAIDAMQATPQDRWRAQATANKQGSGGFVTEWPEGRGLLSVTPGQFLSERENYFLEYARDLYMERLRLGVAREQARKDLPLSTYTAAVWKCDLRNVFHFLGLRMDSHAQQEIREYANIIGYEIVAKLFPIAWEAFVDYQLGAMTLSRLDIINIREMVIGDLPFRSSFENAREESEFREKMVRLGLG